MLIEIKTILRSLVIPYYPSTAYSACASYYTAQKEEDKTPDGSTT